MPRPTASIRGSAFLNPMPARTAVTEPTWYKLPLLGCSLWSTDDNRVRSWERSSNPADTVLSLFIGMHKEQPGIFTLYVENQAGIMIMIESLPLRTGDLEMRFFPETYSFDLRAYRNGTKTLMARQTFLLYMKGSADTSPVRGVWDRFRACVQQMPVSNLRYTNIPRNLVVDKASLSHSRYDLRDSASRALPARARGKPVELCLPNLGIVVTSTGSIASVNFQALLAYLKTGRSVSQTTTTPPRSPSLPPADANDAVAVEEELRQRRRQAAALATVCGYCYEGTVPHQKGSISRLRHRKEWIGCQRGLKCPQDNFWFHLTKECAGVSTGQVPTKYVWWCETCREDRSRANELGLELRSCIR